MQGFASCGIPPGGTVGVCPHTAVHRPSLGWTDGQLKKTKSEVLGAISMAPLTKTTLNNGYLGSRNDEERSEMRYVV